MKLYEGMFLLDNSEARKDFDGVSRHVAGIIAKYGGEVKHSRRWAERKLAYTVKRRDRGTYILVYFDAPPESIVQIKRDCVIDEVILRSMILRASALPEIEEEKPAEEAAMKEAPADEAAAKEAPARQGAEPNADAEEKPLVQEVSAESADAAAAPVEPEPEQEEKFEDVGGSEPESAVEEDDKPADEPVRDEAGPVEGV